MKIKDIYNFKREYPFKILISGLKIRPFENENLEELLIRSNRDDYNAMYYMGVITLEGKRGVKKNYNKALEYFLNASINEDIDTQLILGSIYQNGLTINDGYGRTINPNIKEAIKWFSKAARQGSIRAKVRIIRDQDLSSFLDEKEYQMFEKDVSKHYWSIRNVIIIIVGLIGAFFVYVAPILFILYILYLIVL